MKRLSLFVLWLILTITFAQPSSATRTPLGDVFPQIAASGDRFVIYWSNTVTKNSFRTYYNLKKNKIAKTEAITEKPDLNEWQQRTGNEFSYLTTYFDMECYLSIKEIDGRTIVGGIERDGFNLLKLAVFDIHKNLIADQSIGFSARNWLGLIASNTEYYNGCYYIAWRSAYQTDKEHSDCLILSRWDLANKKLEHRVIHKGYVAGNLSLSIGQIGNKIGFVFVKPDEKVHRFRVVFKLFNGDDLEEIQTITIPYTNPNEIVTAG